MVKKKLPYRTLLRKQVKLKYEPYNRYQYANTKFYKSHNYSVDKPENVLF